MPTLAVLSLCTGLAFLTGVLVGAWVREGGAFGVGEETGAAGHKTSDGPPVETLRTTEAYFELERPPRPTLRTLVEDVDELQQLYEEIGFSPVLEQKVHRLLDVLRASIGVDIPDYDAFLQAVRTARTRMEQLSDQEDADATTQQDVRQAESLLREVWALRDTPSALQERLSDAPVDDQLPFIEQVPVARGGTIHWRTPVRVEVLRKQPADPTAFRRRLDRLAALVDDASLQRDPEIEADLRAAIERLQHDLSDETVYVPALLERLAAAADTWLTTAPRSAANTKKTALDEFVLDACRLEAARPRLLDEAGPAGVRAQATQRYRERAVSRARTYVHAPWMHTDWLTDRLLTHLLIAEWGAAQGPARERLAAIAEEVHARHYDPHETTRRLRALEEDTGFVQSLSFALLRIRGEQQPRPA